MDSYYVVGVTNIPYLEFGGIFNVMSKKENTYHVTIGDISQCSYLDFTKLSSSFGEKKDMGIMQTFVLCV